MKVFKNGLIPPSPILPKSIEFHLSSKSNLYYRRLIDEVNSNQIRPIITYLTQKTRALRTNITMAYYQSRKGFTYLALSIK